jgi:CheY-like chemotaxis protein
VSARRGPGDESGLGGVPSLDGLCVLAVEDEPDTRELVSMVLERCGARVLTAACAADALFLLERERPDVLVADIEMPDEDGHSLLRKIRLLGPERGGAVPAAALTAYAAAQDRVNALRSGFQLHISKPVEPVELARAVASLAGRDPAGTGGDPAAR